MRLAALSVSLALGFAAGYSAQKTGGEATVRRLFVLERSTNLNVVAYDVRLRGGVFDRERPLDVYWLLFEKEGERQELSRLERARAFGAEVIAASPHELVFALAALPSRPITVRLGPQGPLPTLEIQGVPARLEGVFVAARDRSLLPGVHYVEIRGTSLSGGKPLVERLTP